MATAELAHEYLVLIATDVDFRVCRIVEPVLDEPTAPPRVIPVTTGTDLAAVLHEAARQLRHPVALNLHSTQGHSEFDQVLTP